MAKASPAITSFNAGEFSPLMAARSDLKYYNSACKRISNFIPTVQGPARNRPGTKFVREIKDSGQRTWLRRFIFSKTQSYIIEFGHLYARFYTNHSIIESSPGVPYEIATPFTSASLTRTDGTLRLRFAQTGDVLYITSDGQYPVQKMIRLTATTFSIAALETTGGPFLDVDPDNAIVMYASAATGSVSITANAAIFTANHVGSLIFMEQRKADGIKAWEPGKAIALNDVRRSDGKNYQALNAATTGGVKPIHSSGSRYDGDTGVSWDFLEPGYGWAKITGFTSSTVVSATVLSRLPAGAVSAGNPTPRWAFSAFSTVEGYPDSVAFFRERLCFSKFLKLYMSASADYENFNRYDDGGLVTADMAIVTEIAAEETNNIVWMAGMSGALLVGTAGEEFSVSELTQSQAFGPGNVKVSRQTKHGSSYAGEAIVGEEIIFAQAAGRKVRSLTQAESVDIRWTSSDLTVLAEHVTVGGVTSIAYQQEPDSVIWCVKGDGALAGFTLNKEQDVRGWHPHFIGGVSDANGERAIVESIDVIPSGGADELWLIVRRRINGTTKRYVEYMAQQRNACDDYEDAFYVDSGITALNVQTAGLTPGAGATVAGKTGVAFSATAAFPGCPAGITALFYNSIVWSPELSVFVAVAGYSSAVGPRVAVSSDGIVWVLINAPLVDWVSVTWSSQLGLFVAVSNSGVADSVMTSPDGLVWTARTTPTTKGWWSVVWAAGLGLFVAVGRGGTANDHIMTSPDGIVWTIRTGISNFSWTSIAWSPGLGLLVAVSRNAGVVGYVGRVSTSPDGITWTNRDATPDSKEWYAIAWSPELGMFAAVGNVAIMTSPDGISWTARTSPATQIWRAITWSPQLGLFVAVADNQGTAVSNRIMYSSDGIVWTVIATPPALDLQWACIAWSPKLNLFVSIEYEPGSGASQTSAMTSTDGLNWVLGTTFVNPPPSVGLKIQHRYKRSSVACTDTSWGKGVAIVTGCVSKDQVIATIDSGFPDTNVIAGANWTQTADTISGLDHLEGEIVSVAGDGQAQAQKVVVGGAITLESPAAKVHVGLPYRSLLTPMPIEAGAADGTPQGKTKRISRCIIRFVASLGAKFGRSGTSQLDSIPSAAELRAKMDVPADLFTGDVVVAWPDGYDEEALITIVQDDPLPCTVAGLFPQINTQDNR